MAACIDSSRIPSTSLFRCDDSNYDKFRTINDSRISKIIRLCRPNTSCRQSAHEYCCEDQTWQTIREEAERDRDDEPIIAGYYATTILSHASLENSLAANLAFKLFNTIPSISIEVMYEVFIRAFQEDAEIRSDLKAWKERDPACSSYVHCLLYFKGFLAIQAYRVAHKLWIQGRIVLASVIQSRVSEAFAVDIHPGAKIGRGIVLDHATGVVIGETAVIGNGVTILHNVTLGGTGKVEGDRHPKIGDGVLIGAGANVLGNIRIGGGAKIGAGSVVLNDVSPGDTVVGNPAKSVTKK